MSICPLVCYAYAVALPDSWGELTIDDLSIELSQLSGERGERGEHGDGVGRAGAGGSGNKEGGRGGGRGGGADGVPDRGAEIEGTELRPLLAEFVDPGLERAHQSDFFEHHLKPNGLKVYLLLLVTFVPYGLVDYLALPTLYERVLVVRFGLVFPVWLLVTWLVARRYTMTVALGGALTIVGSFLLFFGWIAWVAPSPGGELYFSYLGLVVLGGPVIARWTVRLTASTGAVVIAYAAGVCLLHPSWGTPSRLFLFVSMLSAVIFGVYGAYTLQTAARRTFLQRRISEAERGKSDWLLLNILPESIAEQLKLDAGSIAQRFTGVTVLFADIVGFTPLSARLSPERLVDILDSVVCEFDDLAERHGLEKIKTIGDAYMVAGGLPHPKPPAEAAHDVAQMALAMHEVVARVGEEAGEELGLRIGMHSGPVVAGVIGKRKFVYDLWGDTVNVAARMESHGLPGRIQVSDATADLLGDRYVLEPRGPIEVKGRGPMLTALLNGVRP